MENRINMVKKPRIWYGQVPDDGTLIAQAHGWAIYERVPRSADGWRAIKVITLEPVTHKANFHLGWMQKEQRLSRGTEAKLLLQCAPGIFKWVEGVLSSEHFT